MSDGLIIVFIYLAVAIIVAVVIGLKDCGDDVEAALIAIFWPVFFILAVVISPFMAMYRIGRWISNKLGNRKVKP